MTRSPLAPAVHERSQSRSSQARPERSQALNQRLWTCRMKRPPGRSRRKACAATRRLWFSPSTMPSVLNKQATPSKLSSRRQSSSAMLARSSSTVRFADNDLSAATRNISKERSTPSVHHPRRAIARSKRPVPQPRSSSRPGRGQWRSTNARSRANSGVSARLAS